MGNLKNYSCLNSLWYFATVIAVKQDYMFVSAQNQLVDAVPKMLQESGYPVEIHNVDSQGYTLQVHRIPRNQQPAVLLLHGVFSSSTQYIFLGPKKAVGYLLYYSGMDVWMANLRGTPCGMRHSFLKPSDRRFWNFSFHDHGVHDVTAMTDYIINVTGQHKIHCVGYSMGGGATLVALSERPEYNAKFHQVVLLAPSSYLKHVGGTYELALKLGDLIKSVINAFGITHIPTGDNDAFLEQLDKICKTIRSLSCIFITNWLSGFLDLRVHSRAIDCFRHFPVTTSAKNLLHFGQLAGKDNFCQFDYGERGNLRQYNSVTPPSYNLSRITAPVILFHSQEDGLITVTDVEVLKSKLPNLVKQFFIKRPGFRHVSFVLHDDIVDILHTDVVRVIKSFTYS